MSEEVETVKPGWKTTEFWFKVAADVVSLLYISGVVGEGSMFEKVLGLAAMVLTSLGYSVARGLAKR